MNANPEIKILPIFFHIIIITKINQPFYQLKGSSTLLDNIYTNIPDCYNTCTSGVMRFLTQSAHYPIFTIRKDVEP